MSNHGLPATSECSTGFISSGPAAGCASGTDPGHIGTCVCPSDGSPCASCWRFSAKCSIFPPLGEYSHTWTSLNPSGHIDVDSGRGGVYATWFSHGFYVNGAIYGGHNTYDSGRAGLGGLANGSIEGSEWSTFIGGGYDLHSGPLTVGPVASLQYTDVGVDDFSEKGSLAPLAIHSGSAESLRSDVGFRAFYQWQLGKIVLEPSLKAAWEHEYKYFALPDRKICD